MCSMNLSAFNQNDSAMTLAETHKIFLSHCHSAFSLSPHTMRAYRSDLDDRKRYFGVRRRGDAVGKDHLRQFIRHLREHRRFKETTIKRRLASLKLMFKWATHEEIGRRNDVRRMRDARRAVETSAQGS